MNTTRDEWEPLRLRCSRCSEGCIHLTCGNTTLTFSPDQFRVLADVVSEVRRKLEAERELDFELADAVHSPVM